MKNGPLVIKNYKMIPKVIFLLHCLSQKDNGKYVMKKLLKSNKYC